MVKLHGVTNTSPGGIPAFGHVKVHCTADHTGSLCDLPQSESQSGVGYFFSGVKTIIISTGFTSHREIKGSGLNYSQPISGDNREHAFQDIPSAMWRNETGRCMRNIVVSKHKATLCSTASSLEDSRQTEDQLQRWKRGQGVFFFFFPPPSIKHLLLLSSPLPHTLQTVGGRGWGLWVRMDQEEDTGCQIRVYWMRTTTERGIFSHHVWFDASSFNQKFCFSDSSCSVRVPAQDT